MYNKSSMKAGREETEVYYYRVLILYEILLEIVFCGKLKICTLMLILCPLYMV